MQYWIMKSEPGSYSVQDFARDGRTPWEGVRNYQARNYMRDVMHVGDIVFFYHSACAEPGIVGLGTVCSKAYPDKTARTAESRYFDPKATEANPRWFLVDVCFTALLTHPLTLAHLRTHPALKSLALLRKGNRLSVLPVSPAEGEYLLALV